MSAVYLILSSVLTKLVTFASNQVLLRSMSPQIFGMFAYFDFLLGSVLFFSREAQRLAAQRVSRGPSATAKIITFSYIPVAVAMPISAVLWGLQRKSDVFVQIVSQADTLPIAGPLLAASVAVELFSEPFFAVNSHQLGFGVRSRVESAAVLAKCGAFLGTFLLLRKQAGRGSEMGPALLAYAVGQAGYSCALYAGYWLHFRQVFTPTLSAKKDDKEEKAGVLDPFLVGVWRVLFVQMIFKHLLTEGDTLVLSSLFTMSQSGMYSVISNYGSMAARLVFQPIEESVRLVTAAKLGQGDVGGSVAHMQAHLVFYWNLALLIVLAGYTNGAQVLRVLIGRNALWAGSPVFHHFAQYMVYLPFMAFNGVLEAFFSSASSPAQMRRFSLFLSVSSAAYFALLVLCIRKWHGGIGGLIACNVVNMCLRIAYCGVFFCRFSGQTAPRRYGSVLVPAVLFAVAFSAQQWLFGGSTETLKEFLLSGAICGAVLGLMLVNERERIMKMVKKKGIKTE